jgi:hypothetical protein
MTTASFQNWAGPIPDIGPIYPFVGTEVALLIIGVVAWIAWHVVQIRREEREYKEDIARSGQPDKLRKVIDAEDPSRP